MATIVSLRIFVCSPREATKPRFELTPDCLGFEIAGFTLLRFDSDLAAPELAARNPGIGPRPARGQARQ
jgi:hypothetical protein